MEHSFILAVTIHEELLHTEQQKDRMERQLIGQLIAKKRPAATQVYRLVAYNQTLEALTDPLTLSGLAKGHLLNDTLVADLKQLAYHYAPTAISTKQLIKQLGRQ